MKKCAFLIAAVIASAISMQAQVFMGKSQKIVFTSKTAVENIEGTDTVATMILNGKTGDVIASVNVSGFIFANPTMREHFNENYMESDKYPKATFKGKINETIDYTKDGTYTITMPGTLTMHGVSQAKTITGTLTVKSGVVTIDATFPAKLADYKIEVPSAVGTKIAESVDITVHSVLAVPKK